MTRPAHTAAARPAVFIPLMTSSPGVCAMLSSSARSGERARLKCFRPSRTTKARKEQPMAGHKVTRDDLRQAAEKVKNWGKRVPDDEIVTLNYPSPQDIVAAA